MKTGQKFFSLLLCIGLGGSVMAQSDSKEQKIISDAEHAKAEFIKTDAKMADLFSSAYAYAIFPNVGKGAIGVGGAAGNGVVYQNGALIGTAKMKQVSVGLQLGGQTYREVIFFENAATLERFKNDKIEFSAQVSAVAAASGASANAKYVEGVKVFTMEKEGLMYEASIGGQKFSYDDK